MKRKSKQNHASNTMKIKELHLRNIASIETADIDFENAVVDVNGQMAQTFLISGETGSGKSVIMDGITLALFKTTPRLSSVQNIKENRFTTVAGLEMSVNSIQQYIRIGIPEDAECYSEVRLEASDGNDYYFRLTLGYSKNKKGDIKYMEPSWQFRAVDGQWCKCSIEDAERLVGQSFDQFRRISMLAQGQFETFLVGKKDEREKILEQLTDTQMYSLYGTAISNLAKKKEEEYKDAKLRYETRSEGMLDDVAVASLNVDLQKKKKEESSLRIQKKDIDDRIQLVGIIDSAIQSKQSATDRKKELTDIVEGDDFKEEEKSMKSWDETVTERQKLADRNNAERNIGEEKKKEASLQDEFEILSSDLEAKIESLREIARRLDEREAWLSSQVDKEKMYNDSGAICEQLRTYIDTTDSIESKNGELNGERARTVGLEAVLKTTESNLTEASQNVSDVQTQIDSYSKERAGLNPSEVNRRISEIQTRLSDLEGISKSYSNLEELKRELEGQRKTLSDAEGQLESLRSKVDKVEADYHQASENYDRANDEYLLINASLDEKLIELRRKLSAGDKCPLCGTIVSNVLSDDVFKESLTPLQKNCNEAKGKKDIAEKERNKCVGELRKAEGSIDSQRKELKRCENKVDKEEKELSGRVSGLGLDFQSLLESQINDAINSATEEKEHLVQTQKKAEQLQQKIDNLSGQLKQLNSKKIVAEKENAKAEKALVENRTKVSSLKEELEKSAVRKKTIEKEISQRIALFFPEWTDDPFSASEALSSQSEEFRKIRERYTQECHNKVLLERTIKNIFKIRNGILLSHPKWDCDCQPKASCSDAEREWNALSSAVSGCAARIKTFQDAIDDCNLVLSKSARNEDELLAIEQIGHGKISAYREHIKEVGDRLSAQDGAIRASELQIEGAIKKLGINDERDVPQKTELEASSRELDDSLKQLTVDIANIESRIKQNDENRTALQEAKNEMDAANNQYLKWKTLCDRFGGNRFRTIVQTYIMVSLLEKANVFMSKMTDRYELTCSDENEQLAILVKDKYNRDEIRSSAVLSGGERFMISLALSLALSSLNRQGFNVNILFIDEGFGTLDQQNLSSVMMTLETLQDIAGQSGRRVCIISHRLELIEHIAVQIRVIKRGSGRSYVEIKNA